MNDDTSIDDGSYLKPPQRDIIATAPHVDKIDSRDSMSALNQINEKRRHPLEKSLDQHINYQKEMEETERIFGNQMTFQLAAEIKAVQMPMRGPAFHRYNPALELLLHRDEIIEFSDYLGFHKFPVEMGDPATMMEHMYKNYYST